MSETEKQLLEALCCATYKDVMKFLLNYNVELAKIWLDEECYWVLYEAVYFAPHGYEYLMSISTYHKQERLRERLCKFEKKEAIEYSLNFIEEREYAELVKQYLKDNDKEKLYKFGYLYVYAAFELSIQQWADYIINNCIHKNKLDYHLENFNGINRS